MKINIIFLVLTICWVCFIFTMSSANGTSSSNMSSGVSKPVVDIVLDNKFDEDYDINEPEVIKVADTVHFLVRKCAHVFEYFVLMLLSFGILRNKKSLIYGSLLCLTVSMCDELYQTTVSGRCGVYTDVLVDQIGTSIALILIFFIYMLRRSKYDY